MYQVVTPTISSTMTSRDDVTVSRDRVRSVDGDSRQQRGEKTLQVAWSSSSGRQHVIVARYLRAHLSILRPAVHLLIVVRAPVQ